MNFWRTLTSAHKNSNISWWDFVILCVFFITFSFGQLGRIELSQGTIYAHDCVLLLWLLLKARQLFFRFKKFFLTLDTKKVWLIVAFICWVILGMLISYIQTANAVPFLYFARLMAYSLFSFSLFSQNSNFRDIVRLLLVSSGMYMVVFGLLQYLLIPDSRYLYLFGWDEHYYRLIGPLLDPNLSGILYIIIGWALFAFKHKLPQHLWLALLALTGIAITLTYSRASYLALIISLLFYFFSQNKSVKQVKNIIIAMTAIILIVSVYYVAPKPGGDGVDLLRTTSIQARINTTTQYISSLRFYQWIMGTGFYTPLEATSANSHAQVPDNIFITLLVQTGIVGTVIFFILFTRVISNINPVKPEGLAAALALAIHSQFNNSFLEPFIFLTIGITLVTHLQMERIKGRTQH